MKLDRMKLNYVAVKEVKKEKTAGGLHIPGSVTETVAHGVVVSAGPGVHQNGTWVECLLRGGEHVLFSKAGAVAKKKVLNSEGEEEELFIVREIDVYASLKEDEEEC